MKPRGPLRFRSTNDGEEGNSHAGLWIAMGLLLLTLIAAGVLTVVLLSKKDEGGKTPDSAASGAVAQPAASSAVTQPAASSAGGPAGTLAIAGGKTVTYTAQQIAGWNGACGGKCVVDGDVLSVTMQPGLPYPANGGMKQHLQVSGRVTEVLTEFELKFGEAGKPFDFVKGGKATIGFEMGEGLARSGHWTAGAASARCMWRREGGASLYVYYGKSDGSQTSINSLADQDPEYARHAHSTGTAGHSLWEHRKSEDPLPFFKPGVWHRVQIYGRMNSPAKFDGAVGMSVDGSTRLYSKMRWMDKPSTVTDVTAVAFFGGSDSSWNPPVAETISFRNVRVTTK